MELSSTRLQRSVGRGQRVLQRWRQPGGVSQFAKKPYISCRQKCSNLEFVFLATRLRSVYISNVQYHLTALEESIEALWDELQQDTSNSQDMLELVAAVQQTGEALRRQASSAFSHSKLASKP